LDKRNNRLRAVSLERCYLLMLDHKTMNADLLAEIRLALQKVVEGAPDTCVTFEVEGDSDKWVQVFDQTVNAAYPYSDNPEERLSKLGLSLISTKLNCWEENKFATFEVTPFEVEPVTEWIDAYFVRVLGCRSGEYHLDTAFVQI